MSEPPKSSSDPMVGRVLGGRYRVIEPLGSGGLGMVYRAAHVSLGRNVALKVLHDRFATTDVMRQRFEREAMALSKLSHPNVVTVIDFGSEGEMLFLVMELLEGESLSDRLRRQKPGLREALSIARQILRALAYAHSLGVVHRDLKPANVMVRSLPDGSEHVTVLDFGLAKFVDESGADLTRQGVVLGTPAYMAPEQATGDASGAPADVYAATVMLYELLTGTRPYRGGGSGELLKAHLIAPIPTLREARRDVAFSAELEAFVRRGLAKRAQERFPDAQRMLEAFDALPELTGRSSETATTAVDASATGGSRGRTLFFVLGGLLLLASIVAVAVIAWTLEGPTLVPPRPTHPIEPVVPRIPVLPTAVDAGTVPDAAADAAVDAGLDAGPEDAAIADAALDAADAESPRVPSRDPWLEDVPAELKGIREAIERGEQPSREALQVVYRYDLAHPSDPRGLLLLGHTYTDRGWLGDALDAYRDAQFRDPGCRGDARMLRDLVRITAGDRYGDRAMSYVVGFYGSEARAYVGLQLLGAEDPLERSRLERLRLALEQVP